MGLDASIKRADFKANSEANYYDKLKYTKNYLSVEEILYTNNIEIANIINSRNIGAKKVNLKNYEQLILNKEDIEIIISSMESKKKEDKNKEFVKKLEYFINILKECLNTTNFEQQTLVYSESY